MIKIAIPVTDGKLNAHFGHTDQFYVFEVNNDKITDKQTLDPPQHRPGVYPAWLASMGVTDIIAGGIGQKAISLFNQNKINVFVGVQLKAPEELVNDYINGTLSTSSNYCDH